MKKLLCLLLCLAMLFALAACSSNSNKSQNLKDFNLPTKNEPPVQTFPASKPEQPEPAQESPAEPEPAPAPEPPAEPEPAPTAPVSPTSPASGSIADLIGRGEVPFKMIMPAALSGSDSDDSNEGYILLRTDNVAELREDGQTTPDQISYTLVGNELSLFDDEMTIVGDCTWDGETLVMTVTDALSGGESLFYPSDEPGDVPGGEPVDADAVVLYFYDTNGRDRIATLSESQYTDPTSFTAPDGSDVLIADVVIESTEMRACEVSLSTMPNDGTPAVKLNWMGFLMYFGYDTTNQDGFVLNGKTDTGSDDLFSAISGTYTLVFTDGSADDTAVFDPRTQRVVVTESGETFEAGYTCNADSLYLMLPVDDNGLYVSSDDASQLYLVGCSYTRNGSTLTITEHFEGMLDKAYWMTFLNF